MVERIRQLMEHKGYTSTQFADTVEVPRAVISHIISGRNKPSLDVVIKIVSAFPEISKDWILLGEGEMLKALVKDVAPDSPSASASAPAGNTEPVKQEPIIEQEKVQSEAKAEITHTAPDTTDKSIEQIVVFYSDKTFIAYKP